MNLQGRRGRRRRRHLTALLLIAVIALVIAALATWWPPGAIALVSGGVAAYLCYQVTQVVTALRGRTDQRRR